jgi:hypothetical protein
MRRLAIVGCGPRGLAAMECLFLEMSIHSQRPQLHISLFEPCENPGAGSVWKIRQSDANWLNISERDLRALPKRPRIVFRDFLIPEFPSYAAWSKKYGDYSQSKGVDSYPPRCKMGVYLSERFENIRIVLEDLQLLTTYDTEVEKIVYEDHLFLIHDDDGNALGFDECLIAIGHQPVEHSEEIQKWIQFAKQFEFSLFTNPYDEAIYQKIDQTRTLGLRGFGLTAMDIIRLVTIEKDGVFSPLEGHEYRLKYTSSLRSVYKIVPFNLNGLPPVPKPLNERIDNWFKPSLKQKLYFIRSVQRQLKNPKKVRSNQFLINAFSQIGSEIFLKLKDRGFLHSLGLEELVALSKLWIFDKDISHHLILNSKLHPLDYMRQTSEMAMGKRTVSLDYCLGQVWRHLQPAMYNLFSHSGLEDEVIKHIVDLDESSKRYSYGPPVETLLQMIALSESDVLDLRFLNNPNIELTPNGWRLEKKEESICLDAMIDGVLAPPSILKSKSKVIQNLLDDDMIKPVSTELGIQTNPDGTIVSEGDQNFCISVIDRNSKGSILGTDAILECFGDSIQHWAKGVCNRTKVLS